MLAGVVSVVSSRLTDLSDPVRLPSMPPLLSFPLLPFPLHISASRAFSLLLVLGGTLVSKLRGELIDWLVIMLVCV
jgi:hypothetical protein